MPGRRGRRGVRVDDPDLGALEPDGPELRIEGVLRRLPPAAPQRVGQPVPQPIPRQAEPNDAWSDDDWSGDAESIVDSVLDSDGPQAAETSGLGETPGLGEREQAMLAFERKWWKHAGSKEQAIRDRFQLSATRYYQLLNALLDEPAALAHDPVLVNRLRRLRATRSRTRSAGRAGAPTDR